MMQKIKILYVVNNVDFLISHRLSLLKFAQNKGYSIHVAAPMNDAVKQLQAMGCFFHPWEVTRRGVNPFTEFMALCSLFKIYLTVKPDLTHHVTTKPIIYGGLAARALKIPATVNAVSGLGHLYISESFTTKMIRMLTNMGYAVSGGHPRNNFIFQNSEDEQFFIRKKIVKKNCSQVIPGSGVSMQEFHPLAMPPLNRIVILLAARLIKEKGVLEFIEAARSLHHHPHLEFALAGSIDPGNPSSLSQKELESMVEDGIVHWWGHQKNMLTAFSRCHIVCLPSYREGSPRVLIEAAACARPIITTDTPGCRELVNVGVNGLLIPIKSSAAIAAAVETLIAKPEQLRAMGLASRDLVEKSYAEEAVLSKTLEVYQSLHQ